MTQVETDDPLIHYCRGLPGATEDIKWDDDLVLSVGGKMFAVFDLKGSDWLCFKVDALVFTSLVEQEGIRPAPYLARHHWVQVTDRDVLTRTNLEDFFVESHRLVASKLTKKLQRQLGLLPG